MTKNLLGLPWTTFKNQTDKQTHKNVINMFLKRGNVHLKKKKEKNDSWEVRIFGKIYGSQNWNVINVITVKKTVTFHGKTVKFVVRVHSLTIWMIFVDHLLRV